MSDTIIVALISGAVTLIGMALTIIVTANKNRNNVDTKMAVIDERITTLKASVDKHNNFAGRIPVLEEKIDSLDKRVSKIEKKESA